MAFGCRSLSACINLMSVIDPFMSVPPNAALAAALTPQKQKARSACAVRAPDGRNALRDLRLQIGVVQK
jgi:hypothetical protein